MTLPTPNRLAEAYVKLWNEPDPGLRREGVKKLYAPDATYIMYRRDPFHGHEVITEQIKYTYDIYFPLGYHFQSCYNAVGHHNLVRFNWVMVSDETAEVEMAGQNTVLLAEDGRIQADYQFHEKIPTAFVYNDGYEETGVVTRPAKPTLVSN